MDIRGFTNNRPLCFLATLGGVRDTALGVGYLTQGEYLQRTLLYQHYDALWTGSGYVVGGVFTAVGILTAFFAIKNWTRYTRMMLRTSAFLWLFATIMYFVYGEWSIGIYLAAYMTVASGYLAYFYKFAPIWQDQKRVFRDQFIAENDPLTAFVHRDRIKKKGESG